MKKFSKQFNADIEKTINAVQKKLKRAKERGEGRLPNIPSVHTFKQMFKTEAEAKAELARYKQLLDSETGLKRHKTREGTITEWEYNYLKDARRATNIYLDREIQKARLRYKDYPPTLYSVRAEMNLLTKKKEVLNRDLRNMTAEQFMTMRGVVYEYKHRNVKDLAGRVYFMKNLDSLLTATGMRKTERKIIYDKIDALSIEEFKELYIRHDVIEDIMLTIPSLEDEEIDREQVAEDAVEVQSVQDQLELFIENLDKYIAEIKNALSNPFINESPVEGKNRMSKDEWETLVKKR